jgi:epoxyqueuosine reductase
VTLRTDPTRLRDEIEGLAAGHGLAVASVTSGVDFTGLEQHLVEHIDQGHTEGMDWFSRERAAVATAPRLLHPTVQSIISVGIPYFRSDIEPPRDGVKRGRIARYAWGVDYHDTLKARMRSLLSTIEQLVGKSIEARLLVDTARIVDRAVAQRSGLGWFGKHSNIIVPNHSSFVMLGELLIDLEIEPDMPIEKNCGRCAICMQRCPTNAIVAPYTVHSPRCISFQTIEQRGAIPRELRPHMGAWVFGCDVCQDVCPYTGAAKSVYDAAFEPRTVENAFPSLEWLLTMSDVEFRATYRGTAVTRAKRRGLARNAAIALGNISDEDDIPVLGAAVSAHDEPLVRAHAAWAVGRIDGSRGRAILSNALRDDPDPAVREEARLALEENQAASPISAAISLKVVT